MQDENAMKESRQVVFCALNAILGERGKLLTTEDEMNLMILEADGKALAIQDDMDLGSDLGFSLIDRAKLVAILERYEKPGSIHPSIPFTRVRTVTDLCAIYRECM